MWMADVLGNLSNGVMFCEHSIPLFFGSSKKPSGLFKQSNFDSAQSEFLPCYWGMLISHFWAPYAELSELVELHNVSYAVLFWLGTWHIFVTMIIFPRFGGGVWIKLHHWQIWVEDLNLEAADETGWQWPWINPRPVAEFAARGTSAAKKHWQLLFHLANEHEKNIILSEVSDHYVETVCSKWYSSRIVHSR